MRDKLRSLFSFLKKDERVKSTTNLKINFPWRSFFCVKNLTFSKKRDSYYDTKKKQSITTVVRTHNCSDCGRNIVITTTSNMKL